MNTPIENAAASPIPIRLSGKEYRLTPMTDKDIGELEQWLKTKVIQMARRSLPDDVTLEQREITEKAAIQYASTLTWMSGPGAKAMSTVDGWARILWQGLYKNHPELTVEGIMESLYDPQTLADAQADWERLNNAQSVKGGQAQSGKKKRRRPRKKRR